MLSTVTATTLRQLLVDMPGEEYWGRVCPVGGRLVLRVGMSRVPNVWVVCQDGRHGSPIAFADVQSAQRWLLQVASLAGARVPRVTVG